MPRRIRVLTRPTTDPIVLAPLAYQDAWIGIDLPITPTPEDPIMRLLSDELKASLSRQIGWSIDWEVAMTALAAEDPAAAEWYRAWGRRNIPAWIPHPRIVFDRGCCEPHEEDSAPKVASVT